MKTTVVACMYVWQSRVEIKHLIIPLRNSSWLLCSKHCSAKLLLRAGLIWVAKMHEYMISLHSAYEPRP